MSAAALLDRLGRPGDVRLGIALSTPLARLSTGLPPLDAALGGGLPRGRVTELAGARSTGRTGLAYGVASTATAAGEIIAWVDPGDTLDPRGAAETGLDLTRTLWVRPSSSRDAVRATEVLLAAGGFGLVVLDLADEASSTTEGGAPRRAGIRAADPWPRVARAAERTRTPLLLLTTTPLARHIAALALEVTAKHAEWSGGPGRCALLDGLATRIAVTRNRIGPPGDVVTREARA